MTVTINDEMIVELLKLRDESRKTLSDKEVIGLSVEIRKNSASFYLRTSFNKQSKRISIGNFPAVSTKVARKLSIEYKTKFILDVHSQILGAQIQSKDSITFEEYFETYFLHWCKNYRRSHSTLLSLYKLHLKPRFGTLMVSDLSIQNIMTMVNDLLDRGYSRRFVNKIVHCVRSALRRSEELCGVAHHFSLDKKFSSLPVEKNKERYLNKDESKRMRDYIDQNNGDPIILALGFLLYTGARRSEALNAEWHNIEFENNSWFVPFTKSGKPRYIVLNRRALGIAKCAKKLQNKLYGEEQKWLFLNPITHKPFRCIFYKWNKVRSELGLDDVRIHDLRHSFASTLVNSGATLYEVQKLLGHSKSQTTERYAHLANHRLLKAASLIDKAYE